MTEEKLKTIIKEEFDRIGIDKSKEDVLEFALVCCKKLMRTESWLHECGDETRRKNHFTWANTCSSCMYSYTEEDGELYCDQDCFRVSDSTVCDKYKSYLSAETDQNNSEID